MAAKRCPQCHARVGHVDACPLAPLCCDTARLPGLRTYQLGDGSRVCLLCVRTAVRYSAEQLLGAR